LLFVFEDAMRKRKRKHAGARNEPQQERSQRLVAAILEAAIRVLERDGASAFTTIRIAERAGVSVGSLYQYFPDKQAILARLQRDEWERTGAMLEAILFDARRTPEARVRDALRAFFRSELEEAPMRRALAGATSVWAEDEATAPRRERGMPALAALMGEIEPRLDASARRRAAEMFVATMAALGEHVSNGEKSPRAVDAWASDVADMFLAWLATRGSTRGSSRRARRRGTHRARTRPGRSSVSSGS
jgi:AcrR family transcriptional regulator